VNPAFLHVEILRDAAALASRAADWMLEAALGKEGLVAVALAGGSTPRATYELLRTPSYRERFPWARTHWFWGDERFVPHDDPRSNCRMVWEALLSRVPAPAANIHPVPTRNTTPEAAALAYERTLKSFYGAERLDPARPLFDITLLGVGEDGHMASLFPGVEALKERDHWVAAVTGPQAEPRITLTYPALESSRNAAFLVSGAAKSAIVRRLRAGDVALPAARLTPLGELCLFADQAAVTSPS